MAAPGLEFCFTDRAGGTGGSLVVPARLEARWTHWTATMCGGGPGHGPGPAVLTTPHMSLSREVSLSLSLSLSAAVITVSTLIMTFSDITVHR